MQLNEPVHKESVPTAGPGSLAALGKRFTSAPLSQGAMAFLKRSLARNQQRRSVYRAGHLRVCIDGEERWRFDPGVGVCEPFSVPLGASYMEIFGDDDEGSLLLAVFLLSGPAVAEDERGQHMGVTLEGGQTVAIEVSLGNQTGGGMTEYCISITYSEPAATHTPAMENPAGRVLPLLPRPKTFMPCNAWIPIGPMIIAMLMT